MTAVALLSSTIIIIINNNKATTTTKFTKWITHVAQFSSNEIDADNNVVCCMIRWILILIKL
ncbi:hypothetical protein DERP_008072 [Dermatophagoides pteronyssinus]|uniref:Uncharacterized protein n=1 Tax=Dermatophagoides pteronyssinus TaxID=6956 RepID=A0ABQ8JJN2_DERPT|nr:hypothetical protein DERP_008072 [Dermatophagoides pteronyssinus]